MGNDNPHLERKVLIAAKEEAQEGTAETLVEADYQFIVFDLVPSTDIAKYVRKPSNQGDLGTLKPVIGSRAGGGTWRMEVKGGGHATDKTFAGEFIRMLQIIGGHVSVSLNSVAISTGTGVAIDGDLFEKQGATTNVIRVLKGGDLSSLSDMEFEQVGGTAPAAADDWDKVGDAAITFTVDTGATTADTGLITKPSSDASKSGTIGIVYVYDVANKKGTRFVFRGCRAGLELNANDPDEPVHLQFTPTGAIEAYEDTTVPTVEPAYESEQPLPFLGVGLSILGLTPVFQNLSFSWNSDLSKRKDANNAAGILSVRIKDQDPRGKITPELVPQTGTGSFDFYNKLITQAEGTTGFVLDSGVAGGYVEFYCPLVTIEDVQLEEVDGIMAMGCEFGAHKIVNGAIDRYAMWITRG